MWARRALNRQKRRIPARAVQLTDDLGRYIPAFAQENMRVYAGGLKAS